jgi:hypothetical protein
MFLALKMVSPVYSYPKNFNLCRLHEFGLKLVNESMASLYFSLEFWSCFGA